ncbi:MAG: thioredoxin-dependent thiol peroxidase [Geodermatophilaceae bacterium]|nr:thioredoxin-dependent thiol peroxidase [Geodermatophilaceae bacterium]MDQ3475510.1 thioredoxin-dependent thiol peroxidase [Actinomycetota bacterium]
MSRGLSPGERAPDFSLTAADGTQVSLSDLAGKKAIIYFYPKAMTPGCTTQAIDFQAADDDLRDAGYAVVGISPDEPDALARFAAQEGLGFPLLSDPDRSTLQAYGAYGEKQNYGKTITGVIRSTVVLDTDGTVEHAFYNVKATGHVAKLQRDLGLT